MINFDAVGRPETDQRALSRAAAERHAQLAAVAAGVAPSRSRKSRVGSADWLRCRVSILRRHSPGRAGCTGSLTAARAAEGTL